MNSTLKVILVGAAAVWIFDIVSPAAKLRLLIIGAGLYAWKLYQSGN